MKAVITNQELDAHEVRLDVSLIPDHVKSALAAATYDLVLNILKQPGGREMLDQMTAARKARKAEGATL